MKHHGSDGIVIVISTIHTLKLLQLPESDRSEISTKYMLIDTHSLQLLNQRLTKESSSTMSTMNDAMNTIRV